MVVKGQLKFSESQGALVTSIYWGVFSAGRLLGIWLSIRFAASIMVWYSSSSHSLTQVLIR
jgi:fucose permease